MISGRKFKILITRFLAIIVLLIGFLILAKNLAYRTPKIVLLITIDALRPDHLKCYGYNRNTSQNIDELAKDGVLFTQAVSVGTWTITSMPSIATSLFQSTHGVYYYGDRLNPESTTLAEILKAHGYKTAFFGPMFISEIKGFERGFDCFNNKDEYNEAHYLTEEVIKLIKEHKGQHLFLWF